MIATLAAASLIRHRARTALAILGVAVSAAMLLDMVMLASGMRESFRGLLLSRGSSSGSRRGVRFPSIPKRRSATRPVYSPRCERAPPSQP